MFYGQQQSANMQMSVPLGMGMNFGRLWGGWRTRWELDMITFEIVCLIGAGNTTTTIGGGSLNNKVPVKLTSVNFETLAGFSRGTRHSGYHSFITLCPNKFNCCLSKMGQHPSEEAMATLEGYQAQVSRWHTEFYYNFDVR